MFFLFLLPFLPGWLVGWWVGSNYPPPPPKKKKAPARSKVQIWDEKKQKTVAELRCRNEVKGVRLASAGLGGLGGFARAGWIATARQGGGFVFETATPNTRCPLFPDVCVGLVSENKPPPKMCCLVGVWDVQVSRFHPSARRTHAAPVELTQSLLGVRAV